MEKRFFCGLFSPVSDQNSFPARRSPIHNSRGLRQHFP